MMTSLTLSTPQRSIRGLVIDLVLSQQLSDVAKMPQEPVQLPHRLGCAIQTAAHEAAGQMLGLEDAQQQGFRGQLVTALTQPSSSAPRLAVACPLRR